MFIVTVRLRQHDDSATGRIADAIRHTAQQRDGCEHVYVEAVGDHVAVVLFLLARSLAQAEATAAELVARAREAGPALWQVLSCEAELLLPFVEAALPPDV